MRTDKPNLALAVASFEWRHAYRTELRRLVPDASNAALDPDADTVMQGRMLGDTAFQCAQHVALELKAWNTHEPKCAACLAYHPETDSCACFACGCGLHGLFIRCAVIGGERVALCPNCDDAQCPKCGNVMRKDTETYFYCCTCRQLREKVI